MGQDVSVSIVVGFTLPANKVLKAFAYQREEEFHFEERFDPKTGKSTGKNWKVVDQEGGTWVCAIPQGDPVKVDGDLDEPISCQDDVGEDSFWEDLGDLLECEVTPFDTMVAFGIFGRPKPLPNTSYDPTSHISVDHARSLADVASHLLKRRLDELKKRMLKHGLKAGRAGMHPVVQVYR